MTSKKATVASVYSDVMRLSWGLGYRTGNNVLGVVAHWADGRNA